MEENNKQQNGNQEMYRKDSLDRLSSPEELNDYLHVTRPAVWIMLAAVMLLIVSLIVWSLFASVVSYVYGTAKAENGTLVITLEDEQSGNNVEPGMTVTVGDVQTQISSVGTDSSGRFIAAAEAKIPDGTYDVKIGYKQTQMINFLFN